MVSAIATVVLNFFPCERLGRNFLCCPHRVYEFPGKRCPWLCSRNFPDAFYANGMYVGITFFLGLRHAGDRLVADLLGCDSLYRVRPGFPVVAGHPRLPMEKLLHDGYPLRMLGIFSTWTKDVRRSHPGSSCCTTFRCSAVIVPEIHAVVMRGSIPGKACCPDHGQCPAGVHRHRVNEHAQLPIHSSAESKPCSERSAPYPVMPQRG